MLGGIFSHIGLPDGKVRKGSYVVKIVDKASPITQGLDDFPLKDELYYNVQIVARRRAAGHGRVRRNRLAGRLDPHLRQGPGLPPRARPP